MKNYKRSVIGLIPDDWSLVELKECLILLTDFEANGSFETVANNVKIYESINFAWYVRATDLENETNVNKVKFVDKSSYEFLGKTKLIGNEVLITKRGEIGKVYFFKMKTQYATLAPNLYLLKLNDKVIPYYIYSYFKASVGNRLLIERNASSTLGALYKDDVKAIPVPLPPTLNEQAAIATALSDTDALISGLEKLIEKKRAIKQGAMQGLLRPKADWCQGTVAEVVEKIIDYRGVTPKKLGLEWGGGDILALSANNVQMGYIDYNKDCYFGSEQLYKRWMRNGDCSKDDIIMTMEAPLGNIASIPDNRKYILSQRTILLKPNRKIYNLLLRYILMHTSFQQKLIENASGTTALGIQRKRLEKLKIDFPKNIDEQRTIAQTLNDIDTELAALESKLSKYRQIKSGMMQTLLTGKIRLL